MKKLILTVLIIVAGTQAMFAQKFLTRTGKITFNASAKNSPEKVEAINNEVANVIDTKTGDIVFQVLVKSFKFERALMQEHFNENYMESDKFPKAEFKGTLANLNEVNFAKDGTYPAKVTGKLTIHGITNEVSVPGTIVVKGNSISEKAKFIVKLADYSINIPSVVADKIGKEATISLESDLIKR